MFGIILSEVLTPQKSNKIYLRVKHRSDTDEHQVGIGIITYDTKHKLNLNFIKQLLNIGCACKIKIEIRLKTISYKLHKVVLFKHNTHKMLNRESFEQFITL